MLEIVMGIITITPHGWDLDMHIAETTEWLVRAGEKEWGNIVCFLLNMDAHISVYFNLVIQ